MKNDFDLVVLIDCWPSDHPDVQDNCQQFYKRLISKLGTMNFKYVAFATYQGGSVEKGTDTYETDPYIIQSLSSASEGPHVSTKHCLTIQDVYKNFPHLHIKKDPKILIGGQSWWACLHWRPLGFFGWVNQNQVVHSHPDLVFKEGMDQPTSFDKGFENDPYFKWQLETNCVDKTYWTEELRYEFPHDNPPNKDQYLKYIYM